ncbi:hypothetical protein GGX14DRAFT_583033 [Mycena pura]|uniref:Uncharacterized protein n=1 Tax=Mycena pura TaxID=153505 RepID=A0AAD6YW09_9AGAR|nr:hypothetical protein GGX14DRAFT_583033 [Mycena pura]
MAAVFDEPMEHIDAHDLTPHLRRLSIEYLSAPFDDVFRRVGLPCHHKSNISSSAIRSVPICLRGSLTRYARNKRGSGWDGRRSYALVRLWGGAEYGSRFAAGMPEYPDTEWGVPELTLGQRDFAAAAAAAACNGSLSGSQRQSTSWSNIIFFEFWTSQGSSGPEGSAFLCRSWRWKSDVTLLVPEDTYPEWEFSRDWPYFLQSTLGKNDAVGIPPFLLEDVLSIAKAIT